ncbi:MAG TPA: hypothetical protein VF538_01360 [Pyrinomonadaceae bacterium]|jgi:hypothetical protein
MSRKIEVELAEVKRIFLHLEDLNSFFHSPAKYEDAGGVKEYVEKMYPELQAAYYDIVWNWLPPDVQKQMLNRPSPLAK